VAAKNTSQPAVLSRRWNGSGSSDRLRAFSWPKAVAKNSARDNKPRSDGGSVLSNSFIHR